MEFPSSGLRDWPAELKFAVRSARPRGNMRQRRALISSLMLSSILLFVPALDARSQPLGSLELIADGMDSPSNLASPADGRIYVTEQYTGQIRVIADGRLLPEPLLDVGERLIEAPLGEDGLVGLAFSPEFPARPYVYVTYVNLEGELVLSRFEVASSGLQALAFSEKVLLSAPREDDMHHCGHIAFGPKDRLLYLCIGDTLGNARATNVIEPIAQDSSRPAGKILRLDVEPPVPIARLQLVSEATPEATYEIWAMGLRNPWRFAFDPMTGDMFIPDVSRLHWNEIDFLPASAGPGANFGWPLAEGNECVTQCDVAGLDWPIYEYDHRENHCAVIGGAVYRGQAFPLWQGVFVFADLCSGEIWALRNADHDPEIRRIATTDLMPHAIGTRFDGEILVAGGSAVWRLLFPDSADGGWLPVDRVMFAMITDARRSGFSRSKEYLDRVVHSRTWRWGSVIREIYSVIREFYRVPWHLFDWPDVALEPPRRLRQS